MKVLTDCRNKIMAEKTRMLLPDNTNFVKEAVEEQAEKAM